MDSNNQTEDEALTERIANLSPAKRALLEKRLRERFRQPDQVQPIPPRPPDSANLSLQQERLWVFAELYPDHAINNRPTAFRLTGALDLAALQAALNRVIERHEILRARVVAIDGKPTPIIAPTLHIDLPLLDVGQGASLDDLLRAAAAQPFDLETAPLIRARVYRLSDRHILLIAAQHMLLDGWSVGILLRDLSAFYAEAVDGTSNARLAPLSAQVLDYAASQRSQFEDARFQVQVDYWRKTLAQAPSSLNLPTDFPRPAQRRFNGAAQYLTLPAARVEELRVVASARQTTLFMILLAGFYVLLARYTGETEVVVGSPTSQRTHPDLENLIGFFANTLPLRLELSGDLSFSDLLARVRTVTLEAYTHQDVPEEMLVDRLRPGRVGNFASLYPVTFNFENLPLAKQFSSAGVEFSEYPFSYPIVTQDLNVEISERDGGLVFEFGYDADLFAPATITRMTAHYRALLESIIRAPDQLIAELPLLTEQERQTLLVDWQGQRREIPPPHTLHALFEASVARTPDAIAVECGAQRLTYRELNGRANQLARHLQTLGVGAEVLVGICTERSNEMLIGLLAILKAGGAYLPLDPAYPKDRIAFILEDAQAHVLLTQHQLDLPTTEAQVVFLDDDWTELQENLSSEAGGENVAYVIYTSGSTGKPKGVMVTHGNVGNFLHAMDDTIAHDPPGVWLAVTSISFDISILELFWTLARGFRVILYGGARAEQASQASAEFSIPALMQKHGVTHFQCTPSLAEMLLFDPLARQGIAALKQIFIGGDAFPPKLAAQLHQLVTGEIRNMYGPTETTVWASTFAITDERLSIGRPIANTEFYVVDRNNQPVPVGVWGELLIGGAGVARGYLNRPELTRERFIAREHFIAHPFSDRGGARLYRTGDLVRYFPDGNLEFGGRIDHQVKIRGYRIELGEIESLLGTHPLVREAVVVARDDGGDKRLVAYLVAQTDAKPSNDDLREHLAHALPDYMLPSLFITLEAFPLTPNGKIDRRQLPPPSAEIGETQAAAPRTDAEKRLAKIWQTLLEREHIGIRDNFFDLGGHSLLAVRLMARVDKEFGRRIPIGEIFHAPTIEQLAHLLSDDQHASPLLVRMRPAGTKSPFFCMHTISGNVINYRDLVKHLETDHPIYGLQAPGLDGKEPPLTRIDAMVARYIEEIMQVQAHGPYYLGGFSFGGLLALEVAREFQRRKQEVALLAIFDTIPHIELSFPLRMLQDLHRGSYKAYRRLRQLLLFWRKRKRAPAPLESQGNSVRNIPEDEAIDPQVAEVLQRVTEACSTARSAYTAKPYSGHVTLFVAARQNVNRNDPVWIWKRLARGGLNIHQTPGYHQNIMKEPHVQQLAAILSEYLQD